MPKNQDTTSVKINKIEASHERDKLSGVNKIKKYAAKGRRAEKERQRIWEMYDTAQDPYR